MFNILKASTDPFTNYWYELHVCQQNIAELLRDQLRNAFVFKYADDPSEMRRDIYDAADNILESPTSPLAMLFAITEKEAGGLSISIQVDFVGNSLSGFIVDDILVQID